MFHHDLKNFGTILKTHGIQGELIVSVVSDIPGRFELPDTLFIVINGIPVPFFPEYYEEISANSLKIKFDTICNRDDAMRYYNCNVMADKKFVARYFPKQSVVSIVNYTVLDAKKREIGVITDIEDIPGNPVVNVNCGKKSIMLPVSDELIIEIDDKAKTITLRIPEGLV
jgi:16S rRNA processing protein RimM